MIKKQSFVKATFVSFGVVIPLVAIELELSNFNPHPGTWPGGFYEPDKNIGWKGIPNKKGKYIKGQVNSYVKMNSQGFRDREHKLEKGDDTFRILVLGDSYVSALEVPLEQTFPYLLERKLNLQKNKRVEVMNFGVAGFGTAQEYLTLKHYGLSYHPDLVILNFYLGNDVRNNSLILQTKQDGSTIDDRSRPFFLLEDGKLKELPINIKPHDFLKKEQANRTRGHLQFLKDQLLRLFPNIHLYLNDYLREKLSTRPALGHFLWTLGVINTEISLAEKDKNAAINEIDISSDCFVYAEEYPPEWRGAWEVTKALLIRISKELDKNGIGFLTVIVPDETELRPDERAEGCGKIKVDLEKPDRVLSAFLRETGIKYLQLLPDFRNHYATTGEQLHFPYRYENHWNPVGHAFAAKMIYHKLVDDKLLAVKQTADRLASD